MLLLGPVTPEGKLGKAEKTSYSSGREYRSLPVRGFDQYIGLDQQALWYLRIHKSGSSDLSSKSRYVFSNPEPVNVLKGTGIQFVAHSGSIPQGLANCDISPHGIVLVGQRSGNAKPQTWTSDLFYVPLSRLSDSSEPRADIISTPGSDGKCSRPIFSLDGECVAFIRARDQTKVLSRNDIFITQILVSPVAYCLNIHTAWSNPSSLIPETLSWSNDRSNIYFVAPDGGRRKLFRVPASPSSGKVEAVSLTSEGSVSSVCPISQSLLDSQLLVSKTTFIDSSQFVIVDGSDGKSRELASALEYNHFELSSTQVSEIWFPGAGEYTVHTWIIRPSFFEEGKSYPIAFFVHGGGTGAWVDSWSTRWNPMIIAEQGYVVILPNITGKVLYPVLRHGRHVSL